MWLSLGLGAAADLHLGDGWHFVVEGELDDAVDLLIPGFSAPEGAGFLDLGGAAGGGAEVRLERRDEAGKAGAPARPWRLGGILEVKAAEIALRISDREPFVVVETRLRDAALVVERPGKGFLHYLVPPGGLRADFDI